MTGHLVLPIVAPLAGAILCLALHRSLPAQRLVSLVALASVVLYIAGWLWPTLRAQGVAVVCLGNWPAPYGIVLAADLFSGIMLSLSAVVGLVVLVYAMAWMENSREERFFYPLYLVLFMGVHGALLTGDVFNLYVFFEVMLVASFGLMVLGGERAQIEGAIKYVVISQVSSALFLVGAGLLYGVAGTLNMADLARKLAGPQAAPYSAVVAQLFLVAFGIKAAIFPLYFWLPASYPAAKTPITAVFGGLLTKVGLYALYRTFTLLFPAQWRAESGLLLATTALTMAIGVLGALAQRDLKRLLAFEVISQVGFLLIGLGLGTQAGLAAGIYFFIHIVLAKTAIFLVAGLAEREAGTTDLDAMGGLLRRRPGVATLYLGAALAIAGVPPLSGFLAKYGLFAAGLQAGQYTLVGVALAVSLLTLYVLMRVWAEAFMKKAPGTVAPAGRLGMGLVASACVLLALVAGAAVMAGPLYGAAQQAARQLLDAGPYLAAVLAK